METTSSRSRKKNDPGWKYNYVKDPSKPNYVTCKFCGKETTGGINRAKQHQMGNSNNVTTCLRVSQEANDELWNYDKEKKSQKSIGSSRSFQMVNYSEDCEIGDDDQNDVEQGEFNSSGKRLLTAKSGAGMQGKGKKTKGPMNLSLMQPENIVQRREESEIKQMSVKDGDQEARAQAIQCIAKFFYQARIPFNAVRLNSFKNMVEAIGSCGPNLEPPSYRELLKWCTSKKQECGQIIFSEELEKLEKAIEEDLANQSLDKEIQMQSFSKDLYVTADQFQLKDDEAFCEGPGIPDMFKDSKEKGGLVFEEQLNKLEEELKKDGTFELSWEHLQPEMLAAHELIKQKYCDDYGLLVPVIGEPHHDLPGMQGGTTASAAGSSDGRRQKF